MEPQKLILKNLHKGKFYKGDPRHKINSKNHHLWKGGSYILGGYRMILIKLGIYKFEHRLIMKKALGRLLGDDEVVHHKDGNKLNNRLDNLELLTRAKHYFLHNENLMKNGNRKNWYKNRKGAL